MSALSTQLATEFGRGFTSRNLFNMVRFAEVFPDTKIVRALSAQLSWTHLRRIIYLDDPLQRDFYAVMCRLERWNTRTLHQKIQSMLFERTALSKNPDSLIAVELKRLREDKHVVVIFTGAARRRHKINSTRLQPGERMCVMKRARVCGRHERDSVARYTGSIHETHSSPG